MASKAKRWKYFVGVYEDGDIKYVTETKGTYASWEAGKEAKEFSKVSADEICMGLNFNMIHSVVVKAPTFLSFRNDD